MKWQSFVLDQFDRIEYELGLVLDGLSVEDLNRQPALGSSSIGWLAWHLTRSIDRDMSELMGSEQIWVAGKWYEKWGREPSPAETGIGHSEQQVKEFKSPHTDVIMAYHKAIIARIRPYIENELTEDELDRQIRSRTLKNLSTVMRRVTSVIQDGFVHLGQAAYVRGMYKGIDWHHLL